MEKAFKFRVYPNREQEILIQKTFGCCRFVYNTVLDWRKTLYEKEGKSVSAFDCINYAQQTLKHQYEWLREVDATAIQQSIRDLDKAYKNFFKSGFGYPKFKSKHNNHRSYRSQCINNNIEFLCNCIKLPKLGKVKCRGYKQIKGRILSATVSQVPSGKYYVSLCCTDVEIEQLPKTDKSVGIDLGINSLITLSNGEKYQPEKYLISNLKRLATLQRSLSRKSSGSKNYERTRKQIARLHEKIVNQRKDMLQKLTTDLIRQYDTICIEDLDVKSMFKDKYVAKYLADVSFAELRRMLEYKAEWYGKKIISIDEGYPSTRLCSKCGHENNVEFGVHKWRCSECGEKHDRDINAAINILNEGLKIA